MKGLAWLGLSRCISWRVGCSSAVLHIWLLRVKFVSSFFKGGGGL